MTVVAGAASGSRAASVFHVKRPLWESRLWSAERRDEENEHHRRQ
jgi:hypothetical protein